MQTLLLKKVADGFGNEYSALIATIGVVIVGAALVWAFYYDYQRNKRFRSKDETAGAGNETQSKTESGS